MPAAAVIPAPVAYINVVAVKKLVVGFLAGRSDPASSFVCCVSELTFHPFWIASCAFTQSRDVCDPDLLL